MGAKGRPSITKRQKEQARAEKRQKKEEKAATRQKEKDTRPTGTGEDPDIAGIVPGPQPPIWETENT